MWGGISGGQSFQQTSIRCRGNLCRRIFLVTPAGGNTVTYPSHIGGDSERSAQLELTPRNNMVTMCMTMTMAWPLIPSEMKPYIFSYDLCIVLNSHQHIFITPVDQHDQLWEWTLTQLLYWPMKSLGLLGFLGLLLIKNAHDKLCTICIH